MSRERAVPLHRHARPCAGHPRLSFVDGRKQVVDGRDKPGHDDVERTRQDGPYFTSNITLARAITAGAVLAIMSENFCASSPVDALMSMLDFAASSRNAGSFMVASKARRSACARSGGVPGVVT